MAKVTVLGLGIIGGTWARHYRADGHQVRTWNRTPQPEFPGFTADPGEAVREADLIHLCLAGPPSVEAVLEQILPFLRAGQLVLQSSTISPEAATRFADRVQSTGADYGETPFTGSKPAAEARQVVFFFGGSDKVRETASTYLTPLSRAILPFATPAQAAAIKLSMNLQIATISQALSEGFHLARRHGISAEDFFAVLDLNVARSGLVDLKRDKLVAADYAPQFSIKHMAKDLNLALGAAGSLPLPVTEAVAACYQQGLAAGWGDLDFIALEQTYRNAPEE